MSRYIATVLIIALMAPAFLEAREPTAYVIHTSGETLSKINLNTDAVVNNITTLGSDLQSYPSQIVVRDTMAYVLNSGTDEIQVIDLNAEQTRGYIAMEDGVNPFWLAFLDNQYVYVTELVTGTLDKVDVTTGQVVGQWPVGVSPEGVVIHEAKVYVAITAFDFNTWQYGQGRVVVFDTEGDSILTAIDVGTNPQYLDVDTAGLIHVVCTGDYWSSFGIVYVIDPSADAVLDSIPVGGSPGTITIGPDNIAYLAAGGWTDDGYVFNYNATSYDVYHDDVAPLVVDSGCMMVVAYQDSMPFVGTFRDYVTRIDAGGGEHYRYAVGDGPTHAAFNYLPGDINGDFVIDIGDLVYLVDWAFTGGESPVYPRWRGNMDGLGGNDIADIVYLVDFMFTGGPPPRMGATR